MKFLFSVGLIVLFSNSVSFASTPYDELFPYYAEVCGVTRMDGGGPGGHAVIYLKGACLNREAEYPQVRLCSEDDSEEGTVLSIDRNFKNVEWVGIEGREFALHGGLHPDKSFSIKQLAQITTSALDSKFFEGIQTHDVPDELPAVYRQYSIARRALGTDYALTVARKGSCWKLPINVEQLSAIIEKANAQNTFHQDPRHPYHWNGIGNNCSHFIINLLAAAQILQPVRTGAIFPTHFFLKVPRSSFKIVSPSSMMVGLGNQIKKYRVPSVTEAYRDKKLKNSLRAFGRLPFQHGIILEVLKFHQTDNERYQVHHNRLGRPGDRKKLEKMEKDLDLQDLMFNLARFYEKYLEAKSTLVSLEQLQTKNKKYRTLEFREFYSQYVEWLDESLTDVKDKLSHISEKFASDPNL
jgi:hypothetical protein